MACHTLAEGPTIEDQGDVETAIQTLCRSMAADAAAFNRLIRPSGLYPARIATPNPVLGTPNAASSLTLDYRLCVISLDEASGARNRN